MEPDSTLRDRTLSGLGWSFFSQVSRQAIAFASAVVLARLLEPVDFGLVAMVQALTGFAIVFFELGLGSALIQSPSISKAQLDSLFWINLAVGITLSAVFLPLSSALSRFYGEPMVGELGPVMGLTFAVASTATLHRATLIRQLDFRKLSVVEITSMALAGGAAAVGAFLGLGAWALVTQQLVLVSVNSIMLWILVPWHPRFRMKREGLADLLGFGSSLIGTRIINFSGRSLDSLLIGRLLGSGPLGTFDLAYRVMAFPVWSVWRILNRVMFASLSRVQDDRERVRAIFLRLLRGVAAIVFPMMLGLAVLAEPFVYLVLGQKWNSVAPVLQVLCLYGTAEILVGMTGQLYLSQRRAGLQLKVQACLKTCSVLGLLIGMQWGLLPAVWGLAAASLLGLVPAMIVPCRMVDLKISRVLYALFPIFVSSAFMAVPLWVTGRLLEGLPRLPMMAAQALAGGVIYLLIIFWFNVGSFRDNLGLVVNHVRPNDPPGESH